MTKRDLKAAAETFRLEDLAADLQGSFENGLNACVECCDRYASPGRVALYWESQDGRRATYDFAELTDLSARFAGFLRAQGVRPGDVVAGLLPRIPELLVTILGTWRAGAVYQPLFTAFGPKAIEHRLQASAARLVVTDPANRAKLDEVTGSPPVAVVGGDGAGGDFSFWGEIDRQEGAFEPVLRRGDDAFLMMFTSGTTGLPKGLAVPLKALLSFLVYMRDAIDLRPEDKFWNIADPGWAYGLYYAVTGPLMMGHATTFYDGPFTAESTYRIIDEYGITNLAGAPTAYRLLIAAGPEVAQRVKGKLRVVSSAGEPLNPEVIRWFGQHLDAPIHDHYGQTELGMVVCNHHGLAHKVRPGSAGLAMPGYRVAVLDEQDRELPANQPGILAVDIARSPLLWFAGYWQQSTRPSAAATTAPATRWSWSRTAASASSAVPTTSSRRQVTGSARSTWRAPSSSILRWWRPPSSASPTPSAPRSSRPSSCLPTVTSRPTRWPRNCGSTSSIASPPMPIRVSWSS